MPNRINITGAVEFRPEGRPLVKTGELEMDFQPDTKAYAQGIQTVGTVEETLNVGDVSSVGLIVVINRDDTNYVQIGLTGSYTIKLKPEQFCVLPPAASTLYAIANTASVDVEYYVFPEDS